MRPRVPYASSFLCLSAFFLLTGCASSPSGSSGGTTTTANVTPPAITSVAPATIVAGSASTTLTVSGTGFTSSTAIQIGSVVEPTTYVSATQVTASVPAAQLAQGVLMPIVALNGNLTSASGTPVNLEVDNPKPAISQIAPAAIPVGTASATVSVTGTGFVPTTVIQLAGSARPTTFVSATQVNTTLSAADMATAGALSLTAVNPTPGGGSSPAATVAVNNPAPGSIALNPNALTAGGALAATISVAGTNFLPASVVQVGGANRATTFVSATQLTFQLTVADQAVAANLNVTVVTPAPGGGTSPAATLALSAPAPTVSAIAPATLTAGAASTSLTVTGTGFTGSTSVQVGSTTDPTTFVSATQLTVAVPASQLAQGAFLPIIALNGNLSSASGTPVSLEVDNPAPKITAIIPSTLATGSASTTVSVTGTGFLPNTTVQLAGSARPTAFVSSTQVDVILSASDLASSGSLSLMAVNPTPGGGSSAAASIAVNNPTPGGITLNPTSIVTGATSAATVTVTGTNFISSSTVQVGGSNRATTYVSATQLTFQLTVADQATAASLKVTVVNAAPGGGTSPAATLTLAAPTPTPVLTQVSPTSFLAGSAVSEIYVYGSNLTAQSVIQWNGTALSTGYGTIYSGAGYTYYLAATVPANLLTTVGTASITVSAPTAPALSNALPVSIVNPPAPTLTSVSPSSGPINTTTSVTLFGTGFTAASTVAFNGTNVAATYVNSTQLTVALPASSVTLPGNGSFTVTTPAPGGGTTAPMVFTSYIGIVNNSMVYNPVNGLFYVSVPSSAGAPYGNSVVSVDPETGALGTPIQVGSEPNKLAISSDGTILWVGLDGASAVRQVNLTTNTAGLQFSLGGNGGIYETPGTALALAALPGSPNSVVVSASSEYSNLSLAIYDSGVLRGSATTASYNTNYAYALLVNGSKSEIYAGGGTYDTYTYSSTGLTLKAASTTSATYASATFDEMQIANGVLYTDTGEAFDPESGSLLGTFYSSGTTLAAGPTVADSTLGKLFVLDDSVQYSYGSYNQIQVFNTSNYTSASSTVIPVSVSTNSAASYYEEYASRLTRWGTNGLAFRTGLGVYSLRSNLVKDLSSTSADLGVTVAASGTNATGSNTTYTATITNAGPSASTNIALTAALPSTGVLVSANPSTGSCSSSNGVSCDLGGLANGASATVTLVVQQLTAGTSTLTVQVSGSENDPTSSNNQATSTQTITGNTYSVAPSLTSISPSAILTGAGDTVITVTGSGFANGATVQLGSTALTTNYTSSTTLTATVPSASAASLGWGAITVSNPTPGGVTAPLPLSFYSVLTVGVNHILYEPFTRKIYASVGSGSTSVTGNSIAPITPETATIGTPVYVGSQPTKMAISDDGNILYSLLGGANSIARFNLQTQQTQFTISPSFTNYGSSTTGFRDIAVQTGSENTIAVDFGYTSGMALIDINPTAKTGTIRGSGTGLYTGTSLHFYNAQTLYLFNSDTWQTLDQYAITSAGFSYNSTHGSSTLLSFGIFQLAGKLGFANAGGLADVTTTPATQLGIYKPLSSYGASQEVVPDTSLGRVFFLSNTSSSAATYSSPDGIVAYNQSTFLPTGTIPLNMAATEGNTSYTGVDLIRWGQDGLAALTSGGHIYLLRGAAVVPQLLNQNSAATLSASSVSPVTHGAGNTLLTLTGSNFIPGVAVQWNGSYRTTTIVDATHVTVAIPASDLTTAASASLTAVNPGASASSALTFTIN
jgi:hypothetical protein